MRVLLWMREHWGWVVVCGLWIVGCGFLWWEMADMGGRSVDYDYDAPFEAVECAVAPETMGRIQRERCTLVELRRIADALEAMVEGGR